MKVGDIVISRVPDANKSIAWVVVELMSYGKAVRIMRIDTRQKVLTFKRKLEVIS